MTLKLKFIYLIILVLIFSCSKKQENINTLQKESLDEQMIELYNEAMEEFERGDVIYAGKKFSEAELLYPQSIWAPRAVLMSAYGYFLQGYYKDAINDLERFIVKYKNHPQSDYAYYLLALCHYDQIVDERKDMNEIILAKKYFELILDQFPNTDYALDSSFKLELIIEVMDSIDMFLASYFVQREMFIPAIRRFNNVINDYDKSIYVEEALHRLVELHYKIGLIEESEKYATLLGYNYRSSKWYEASYKILNKNYNKQNLSKKDNGKNNLLKKFKELFN